MDFSCPICKINSLLSDKSKLVRYGSYFRRSDRKKIIRYKCCDCQKHFSQATQDACFRQLKRQYNPQVYEMLCSGVSQRRLAYLLRLNRKTIKRKFLFLSFLAVEQLKIHNSHFEKASSVEFDDLETFEHTKCKPLSVTMAVEEKTRRILGLKVSKMPAKGHLAKTAFKKYGPRRDERSFGRKTLFQELKPLVTIDAQIKSDQNPHYIRDVKKYFPQAVHFGFKGKRGAIVGQGELKKVKYDPLFSLNHTFAKLRADVNRLIRKTWCTTKRADYLELHLNMYAFYHNQSLLAKKRV